MSAPKISPLALLLAMIAGGALHAFELEITPVINGKPLSPGHEPLENRAGEQWRVTRLSYLVSGLAFRGRDGAWREVPSDPAWMSLIEGRSTWTIPEVPEGDWTAVRFDVGLPPALNDRDPAVWPASHPLNPNLNGLHWSWQGGYIFLALEGRFWKNGEDPGKAAGFAYHLARDPYRATLTISVSFTVGDNGGGRIGIEFDPTKLIDGKVFLSFTRDGSATHSKDGDPLAAALRGNLDGAFRTRGSDRDADPTNKQKSTAKEDLGMADFPVPPSFPKLALPKDARPTPDRIALGRRLFHETALSRSGTLSCSSCHILDRALSDPRRFSVGEEGRTGSRNGMPLFNLAWKSSFFWDGRAKSLREQILEPIEDHRELDERIGNVVTKLKAAPEYETQFAAAFGDPEISPDRLARAIESFLLTLVSNDSRFDRAQRGEEKLTALEQRGFELFMTERDPRTGQLGGDCFHCHGGTLFTDHQFRNNGLAIDPADPGRATVTGSPLDRGTFATPSLRNIDLTAPYMHDGRFATLEEVLDHYSEGVSRTDTLDPNLAKHPDGGLALTEEDKTALIAFLRSLTDTNFSRSAMPGDGG